MDDVLDLSKIPGISNDTDTLDLSKIPGIDNTPIPEGKSHGIVVDTLWNLGKKALEPTLPEAETTGHRVIGGQMYGIPDPTDPNTYKGLYNEVIRPLSSPAGLLSLGAEGAAGLYGKYKNVQAVNSKAAAYQEPKAEVLPPEEFTGTETYNGPRQLPAPVKRLELPAQGETTSPVNRVLYQDKKGTTSTDKTYPIDTAQPGREPGWNPYTPEGEVTNLDPLYVAEEGQRFGTLAKSVKTTLPSDTKFPSIDEPNDPISTRYQNADEIDLYGNQPSGLTYGNIDPNIPEVQQPFNLNTKPLDYPELPTSLQQNLPSAVKPLLSNRPGGQIIQPVKPQGVPFRTDTLTPEESQTFRGGQVQPVEPVEDTQKPSLEPGEATPGGNKGNDVRPLAAEWGSPDRVLSAHEETKPIVDTLKGAQENRNRWVYDKKNQVAQFMKGIWLPSTRKAMGKYLETGDSTSLTPDLISRVDGIRKVLDETHKEIQNVPGGPEKVGYISNYFTHMAESDGRPGLVSSFKNLVTSKKLGQTLGSGVGDMFEKGSGSPDSPYVKTRTGQRVKIDYDINSVLPKYFESLGRYKFDMPASDAVKGMIAKLPDNSIMKETAKWYHNNFTRYDSAPQLHKAADDMANAIATQNSRFFMQFNPLPHVLHVAEIMHSVYPELGEKNLGIGVYKTLSSPFKTTKALARNGLLQGDATPTSLKTGGQLYQSATQFWNLAETLTKGIAYNGGLAKFGGDVGKALQLTRDSTFDISPINQMKGLSPEASFAGGEGMSRLGWQYKGIPMKIAERILVTAIESKKDPIKAARMAAGTTAAIAMANAGAHTFHMNISSMVNPTLFGPAAQTIGGAMLKAYKGDAEGALADLALYFVPGGAQIKKLTQ